MSSQNPRQLLADALFSHRIACDLTIKELSERTGICKASIGEYERGVQTPPEERLETIMEALYFSDSDKAQLRKSAYRPKRRHWRNIPSEFPLIRSIEEGGYTEPV